MAKLEQGILGPFRGKVGTVVGFMWRGKHVVRAYRREINYPNTENQQVERAWFVSMVRFAATARPALLLGLRERAARWQMTEGNAFVKMNKNNFGLTPGPSPVGEGRRVEYERICISEGSAAPVRFSAAGVDDEGVLRVAFGKNGGMSRARGGDRVYLYIYNTATRQGLLSAPAERRSGRMAVQLPDGWTEGNVRLWGFVMDGEGRASNSAYIGWDAGEEEPRNGEKTGNPRMENEEKMGLSTRDGKKSSSCNSLIFTPPPSPYKISLKNENFSS